jgi:hypothetical protein
MILLRFLKPGLFLYECLRIIILAVFVLLQPIDPAGLPRLVFLAPGVLFPLMALFIWLDIYRYKVYLPLFAAGKCICVIALIIWSFITQRFTVSSGVGAAESFLLCGDIFSILVLWLINKHNNFDQYKQIE